MLCLVCCVGSDNFIALYAVNVNAWNVVLGCDYDTIPCVEANIASVTAASNTSLMGVSVVFKEDACIIRLVKLVLDDGGEVL